MKREYTAEEKRAHYDALRERWQTSKAAADQDIDMLAKFEALKVESPSGRVSFYSFYFTLSAMRAQGLDGWPYVDAKTFKSWRDAGFTVKKGEHSTLDGITWVRVGEKEDEDGYLMLKGYALFHRSQVEPITV